MDRKRILRWVAAVCLLVLAVCTGISSFVYDALLPRVEVLDFLVRDTPDPNDYGAEWLRSRDGIFGIEYFVEAIDGEILREADGEVELDAPAMDLVEKLVLTTDKPLRSGTVVSISNPEVWQE